MPSDASTVRVALRDLVLGDDPLAAAAARRLTRFDLWPTAVALSGQWRMTPVLRERLGRLDAGAPDPASGARLREMTIAATAHSALAVTRSREVLALLERAGVEAVAIKGVALIASLYGHRSVRMVGDLDLVVREGGYAAARNALAEAGYVDENLALDRHLSDIALSPHLHNVARNLVSADFEVDVHWQFGFKPPAEFRTDRVIERAQPALLAGTRIRVAAPPDAMTIAAHHSLRGYFAPHEVVKDAYDLAAWWSLRPNAWRLDDVIDSAIAAEVATALYALWELVRRRAPGHAVAAGVSALGARLGPRARCEAEQLADFCEEQFERGTRAERTVQIFDAGRLCRTAFGHGKRLIAGAPPEGPLPQPPFPRRPIALRLAGAAQRVVRVARDLAHVRAYGRYRALARAQGRHH
ncbi:MAG TPA: nucleotidyltransferase family protein [Candidatus Lustribacter sp.]